MTEPLDAPETDRILTIPNVISVVRLLCVPLFLYLLFGLEDREAAAWLLAILGATDWVDGYIARRWNQVSELGKILDPVADRIMLIVAIVAITVDGSIPVVVAVLGLGRELLVAGATLVLAALGARRIDVTWYGKAGTMGLMIALPLFLVSNDPTVGWAGTAEVLAWIFAVPGLALGLYSLWLYVPLALEALREGRAARAEATSGG
ncbi:MAG: CDP-diacylglycerol--glycerol-3-phosphate 3-phosphatidyltransferase [Actinomycetota bacterium]